MRAAVAFLTVLGRPVQPDARTLYWFPVVGAGIGLVLGAIWWMADSLWLPLVAAALVVAADLALTGLLHLDGLADSADGLLPPLDDAERRLTVMADPATGAFGVAVVATVLILRTTTLATLLPVPLALAGIWCASRTVMAIAGLQMRYVRPQGLASDFVGDRHAGSAGMLAGGGLAAASVLGGVAAGVAGIAAIAGVVVGGLVVLALAARRIGGFTGDVLGAAGVIGETVGLLVLAARW